MRFTPANRRGRANTENQRAAETEKKTSVEKATKAEEAIATLAVTAIMTAPVLAAAIFCCCNNNNIQMQNCKVQTRKKKQKRKPLQTEFFADSKILGFISLSKLYRNTNKNQAFLIPKAKKPRPRKASSHLMVETPPQPRARPPLL